jgi:hypothetical protein
VSCSLKKLIYKICSCHDIVEILLNLIFAFIAVDGGFEPRSGHAKDYYIVICCFSACIINEKEQRLVGLESG